MRKTKVRFSTEMILCTLALGSVFLGCGKDFAPTKSESSITENAGVPIVPGDTTPVPKTPSSSSGGKGALGILPGRSASKQLSTDPGSKYYVYVPTKYKEETPIGMVLVFHGVTGEPSDYFQILRDFANADRFVMIAPAGDPQDGAGGAYCQPYAREIMEAARSAFNIDDSKQYITGHSAGSSSTVYLAMTSEKRTAKNACGQDIQIGFQSEFAGVGFSSPVASVPSAQFFTKTAEQLGFIPAMWSEYGELSADGAKATALSQLGKNKGYAPSTLVERKGEGHTPNQPFSNYKKMFDLFEATRK